MSSKLMVVSGEASETDSDDDKPTPKPSPLRMAASVQGAVITGEDSESDNEFSGSVGSAISALTPQLESPVVKTEVFNSLLHKKLRESNRDIHRNFEAFIHTTISEASTSLGNTEQSLLKSQLTLQNALTSLRSLNNNSVGIKNKLKDILSSRFLSNVTAKET